MQSRARSGFTLIELLIVIVIIGLLAVIAIPKLWKAMSLGNESAVANDLRLLVTAQEIYFDKHIVYASALTDLSELTPTEGTVLTITHSANTGWAATGTHPGAPNRTCAVRFGTAPLSAAPVATEVGSVHCAAD